jgi:catechol 2,3-dioxygenase-like lactoylglutathione lyase family enzyme
MRINRITANIETSDIDRADAFYHDVLGLVRIMDHGIFFSVTIYTITMAKVIWNR